MSLLDTFTIMFEADTSKVQAGEKKAKQGADELVDSLKKADKEADKTGHSFQGLAKGALGWLAAAAASGAAIAGVIGRAGEIADVARMADAFGLAVEDVDAFGRAAVAAGGDAKGARDSIVDMAETIGEALQDVESNRAKILGKLGVSLRDVNGNAISATDGLLALAGAVEGMSREEATFNVKQLGITDNKTVEMLLKGRAELERLLKTQKEQGVITKEQAIQAQKFTEAMNVLKGGLNSAGTSLTTTLLPALTVVVEWLTKFVDFLGSHKDLVTGFFIAVAGIITAIYLPAMISAATATLAATWPLLAIIAAITAVGVAFALVYDDIMNFIDGNDSLIGLMIDKVSQFIEFVAGIPEAIAGSLEAVGDLFSAMGDGIMAVWDFIAAGIRAYIDFIMAGVAKISEGIGAVASFFGLGDSDTAASVESGQQAIAAANASPLNSVTSNSISNSVASSKRENNLQIGELTVQTQATDAGGVARGVSGELGAQLAQMDAEFSSGVAR